VPDRGTVVVAHGHTWRIIDLIENFR